ncbi:hypothetical protein GCM10028807_17530 [Spirosoma daeguense]
MITKEILKMHLGGIQGKLDFSTMEPFANFAERWFSDQVGRELVAYLAGLQNPTAGTPDPIQGGADLLYLAQSCISWRCYELAFPHLKMRVGDLGLQKLNTQNTVAIAKWEYVDSKEANVAMLDLALENFWRALEEVRPAVWTGSSAYKKRQRYFIRSAYELAQSVPTMGRKYRLFDQLLTYIKRAEYVYIKPMLGGLDYQALKANWSNPDHELTEAETAILEFIQPALAHLAIYEAYPYLPLHSSDETGITERRSKGGIIEDVTAAPDKTNSQKRQLYMDGQFYLGELQEYLQATASAQLWPGYYAENSPKTGEESDSYNDSSLVIL